MKKLSSYQKLKIENQRLNLKIGSLNKDIYNIVKKKNEYIGKKTFFEYDLLFTIDESMEQQIWYGEYVKPTGTFEGIENIFTE